VKNYQIIAVRNVYLAIGVMEITKEPAGKECKNGCD